MNLYADSAPNLFGSPAWAPWWASARADMEAGTFENMRSGAYPGSLLMSPHNLIVYSTGDLGRRLHTMFWIPDETTASLDGRFQMRYCLDWDGVDYVYDFGLNDYVVYDGPTGSAGWVQPAGSWSNYSTGVVGNPGWAWWATDDDAPPFSTDANPYNETDAADVEALARIIRSAQTYFRLEIRTRATIGDAWGNYDAIQVNIDQPAIELLATDTCVNASENLFVDVRVTNSSGAWDSVNTFDAPVPIAATQAPGVWYTDRYAPAIFAQASFDGDDRLHHGIDAADGADNRPPAFSGAFYNTQGRKFDLPTGTNAMAVDLYVPADWATTGRRMAGLWGTAVNDANVLTGYPILEFTSDGGTPRFRGWDNGFWIDMGLPTGFAYDQWVTLTITLSSDSFSYSVGDLAATVDGLGSARISNVILQGHNTTTGVTYDIYWDNFAQGVNGTAGAWMAGIQTIVDFDSTRLDFVGATAEGPFPLVVFGPFVTGDTIIFANGVGFGDSEVKPVGTVTVARLEFQPKVGSSGCDINDLVAFSSWSVFSTQLTDEVGTPILSTHIDINDVTIDLISPVLVGVPGDVTTPCDAGETYATVPVTPPTATDNLPCGNPVVTLLVTYPDSSTSTTLPVDHEYPIGTTTLQWTATDECGNTSTATTTITVLNASLLNLDITLSGTVGGSHTRDIRVRWGPGALNALVPVNFVGANGTASVLIAPAGVYTCFNVKDEVHTLANAVTPSVLGGEYFVSAFLIQGDSNNDNLIDILDFGLFVGDFGPAAQNGRSNFNADFVVNNADFTFISLSFFSIGESCGAYADGGAQPLASIHVKELAKMGLAELAIADLNGDGWVDSTDIALFMQGVRPKTPAGRPLQSKPVAE
ncbi:MAG: hypothetical protein KF724_08515 [Phycisphaeraceae bacterium]|nr:hypothetical protein [Phycisphaeraceae bacterium]